MEPLITVAAHALATGDSRTELKQVALRDDPLHSHCAALPPRPKSFAPHDMVARARCLLAEAEIALVSRDLAG